MWRAEREEEMSELEPTPELPDDTPIREIRFPERIKDALFAAGLKTVGQVREMSDDALLALPDFGKASVSHLRETLGLSSAEGVRPLGKKPT
jgi:DNA-directed RNA polymerase alpha subunit